MIKLIWISLYSVNIICIILLREIICSKNNASLNYMTIGLISIVLHCAYLISRIIKIDF